MPSRFDPRLRAAYDAFNRRDIDAVLLELTADVAWANGMDGGFVHGHAGVRDYWTQQWQQIDPHVRPLTSTDLPDGRVDVEVRQIVRDLAGAVLADRTVHHVYTPDGEKFSRMEIVAAD